MKNTMLAEIGICTDYCRVIPRDLFNEAKLLKCMGRLILNIHDGAGLGMDFTDTDGMPFAIGLMDDGCLTVYNITVCLNGTELLFRSCYNSKGNFPLVCTWDFEDITVFDDAGEYTEQFKSFCQSLTAAAQ